MTAAVRSKLLFYSENCVLCHFSDSEFENGFSRNPDLLLCLGIKARARLPLLLHQLAKTGQDKFAVLFNLFISERAERIREYSSGSFVGLGCFGNCALKAQWPSTDQCHASLEKFRRPKRAASDILTYP